MTGIARDKALSLRDKLMVDKSLSYNYPFIHYQSFSPPDFSVSAGTPAIGSASLVLQSFINADLLSIIFYFVNVADLTGNNAGASAPGESLPNFPIVMRDLQVLFNGQVYYNSPGTAYQLYNIHSQPGASYFQYSVPAGYGSGAIVGSYPAYFYRVDFSREKTLTFESKFANVMRLSNQVLTLTFTPPADPLAAHTYRMYCTYCYNGVASLTDGQSKIYFD
jgi:hypothetical protein